MNYTPVSDKEFNERMMLPAGAYAFEVLTATAGTSRTSGADMITLELLIHTEDGGNRKLKSYLVASDGGKFAVRAFCESVGLMPEYRAGKFTAESCLGRAGWVRLKVEAGRAKDDGSGNWPDKNAVATYLSDAPARPAKGTQAAAQAAPAAAASQADGSDDVPFDCAP